MLMCRRLISTPKFFNHLLKVQLKRYTNVGVKSLYEDIRVPDQTVTQFIYSRLSEWEDLPALTCGVSGRSYTYGLTQMLHEKGARAFLQKVNLKPGDVVGFVLPNIPEFGITINACVEAGLVVTFANPLLTVEEIKRQFKNARVKCIVTIQLLLNNSLAVAESLTDYTYTINIGGETNTEQNIIGMQELLTGEYDDRVSLPKVKGDNVAVLAYSSGTTGLPKAVMLTHKNLIANLLQCSHPKIMNIRVPRLDDQEIILSVLPFFHIMGFNAIMNLAMCNGAHLITIPKFTPDDYLNCLIKYKPSALFVVPSLIMFLATHPQVEAQHLASVSRIICGAAPIAKDVIDKFMIKLARDDCSFDQGYGMTESSPVTLMTPTSMPLSKRGSCGTLLPSTEARVLSINDGTDITAPYASGEILLRGPQIMKGYLNDPTATSEAIDSDSWLHTGDIGHYDDDGYFYITGRTKELIKVKGNQVSPTELESLILEIPGVSDVAVVGIPDDLAGEVPKAFIVKNSDANIDQETILKYLTPKVAIYKRLAQVSFIDAIPRNISGKILRHELKSLKS